MKVDFIVLGAMKAGTTTLSEILKNHPQISFCKEKEPDFFSISTNWRNQLNKYHSLFTEEEGKIYGEASTSYSLYPECNLNIWDDIYSYNKKMKFIYLVRNPVERVISHYMQYYQKGRYNESIEKAIIKYPGLINATRYYTQISPFIQKFGKEQVLIIDFDDLIKKQEQVLQEISDFLNVNFNGFSNINKVHSNPSVYGKKLHYKFNKIVKILSPVLKRTPESIKDFTRKIITNRKRIFKEKPKLSLEYQKLIINFTKLDITKLEKLTGKNYSHWLKTNE